MAYDKGIIKLGMPLGRTYFFVKHCATNSYSNGLASFFGFSVTSRVGLSVPIGAISVPFLTQKLKIVRNENEKYR